MWHERHDVARGVLERWPRLPAHAALESYSVLTRMPPSRRSPAGVVRAFLERRFPEPLLTLSQAGHRDLLDLLAREGIVGGATYDALIAAAARGAGARLLTLDARAARTYAHCQAEAELLSA